MPSDEERRTKESKAEQCRTLNTNVQHNVKQAAKVCYVNKKYFNFNIPYILTIHIHIHISMYVYIRTCIHFSSSR